ncbi:DUF1630-domain-containing protein [Auriscalpium vulgare]|uniref:DUF1630-domain-containing protein n=1 Tax=Auriscalpium vulgare TaxID=40419 RepID=A0ACB8RBI1_9AGAM|nr:DUF1630-domain-containing protein [Auriscalpium vulgare]
MSMDKDGGVGVAPSSRRASASSSAGADAPAASASTASAVIPTALAQKRRLSKIQRSPSSAQLSFKPPLAPLRPTKTLTRTRSLPLRSPTTAQANIPSIQDVAFDPERLVRLHQWALGLAIGTPVDFDLDLGPVISCIFPPLQLYPFEAENIAFSAFPDSPQFREGSQMHSFRIQGQVPPRGARSSSTQRRPVLPDGFIYGYSHFNQRRDPASKRGYVQRSVVILTHYPYPALFYALLSKLGPMYHAHGEPILEVACHNIANWSAPAAGLTIELGFVGSVLHVELPQNVDEQQLSSTAHLHAQTDQDWHILACAPPPVPPPLNLFESTVSHLWSIWECLVLCEPILLFGHSPAITSQAVWWLRDLFRPIPWAGDFRPYYTIHDKDHNVLVNDMPPKAGLLLGVTNPFFEKACSHWPHVLSLGGASNTQSSSDLPSSVVGPPPGWKTKTHKRFISKDRQLLQQMEDAFRRGPLALEEASTNLRRHFSSRSAALLVPLNRYLNTLIPSPAETIRTPSVTARLKPFNNNNFLASLKTHGAVLPFRSAQKQRLFYERWLRTPAFGLWLARQEEVVERVLAEKRTTRASTPSA